MAMIVVVGLGGIILVGGIIGLVFVLGQKEKDE